MVEGRLTTADLRARLDDVPAATLYRQVTVLLDGEVLEVVEEHRVRGAIERTLALRRDDLRIGADEARAMTRDEHRQGFLAFTATLLADFDRYLARDDVDLGRDRVGYGQVPLHLTDAELDELLRELQEVVLPRLAHEPGEGRTPRVMTTIVMPSGG